MRRYRFTLVELLVVIAIIVVLISFLMPGLRAARNAAKGIKCLGNERQLGLAFMSYLDDFDQRLWGLQAPSKYNSADCRFFYFADESYTRQKFGINNAWLSGKPHPNTVYYCPAGPYPSNMTSPSSYVLNTTLLSVQGATSWPALNVPQYFYQGFAQRVPAPSQISILGEGDFFYGLYSYGYYWGSKAACGAPHNGGAQLLFFDGHAAKIKGAMDNKYIGRADLPPSSW